MLLVLTSCSGLVLAGLLTELILLRNFAAMRAQEFPWPTNFLPEQEARVNLLLSAFVGHTMRGTYDTDGSEVPKLEVIFVGILTMRCFWFTVAGIFSQTAR